MEKIFKLTNKYIILATPLILYSLFSTIYLLTALASNKLLNLLFALVLFILMISAFIAGWFNMIKLAIIQPERENPNTLLKEFIPGVGEYFLSSIGAFINITLLILASLFLAYICGAHFIGDLGINLEEFSKSLENTNQLKQLMATLSPEQTKMLLHWNTVFFCFLTGTYFLLMLYIPTLFFKSKNPYKAFFITIKDVFSKNFFKTLGIFLLIFFTYIVINVLSAIIGNITIAHFLITLLNFYFITVSCVGVFYYYYNSFITPYIGQNVDVTI